MIVWHGYTIGTTLCCGYILGRNRTRKGMQYLLLQKRLTEILDSVTVDALQFRFHFALHHE